MPITNDYGRAILEQLKIIAVELKAISSMLRDLKLTANRAYPDPAAVPPRIPQVMR